MLRLVGVSKSYGGAVALHPTDLEVPAGSTTVLIGPSGCGKSTLLRLLVGLVRPDAGTVLFDGTPVPPGTAAAVRRQVGFVVQDGGLFPHLTALGNVTLMALHLGRPLHEVQARLAELTELTRLPAELLGRYPA